MATVNPQPAGVPLGALSQLALQGPATAGFAPFTQGPLGFSPATQAALQQFNQVTRPGLQNQAALAGLGNSPALLEAISLGQAQALPGFISQDLQNRLTASQGLQQGIGLAGQLTGAGEQLGQSAAGLAANISGGEAQRQLQAAQISGNLLLGQASNVAFPAAQTQLAQQQQALTAFGGGGQLQRGITQEQIGATQQERLRQQALSEQATTGIFGGSVLPPTLQQTGTSNTTGGGK